MAAANAMDEFEALMSELEALVASRATITDRKKALDIAERRYAIQCRMIELLRPQTKGTTERRTSVRIPCQLPAAVRHSGSDVQVTVRDIGGGGCLIETATALPLGTSLDIAFLPSSGQVEALLAFHARVAWARPNALGLAFQSLDESLELQLLKLILRVHRSRPPA